MPAFLDHGVKCGNCKQYHESAAHVKVCFQEAKAEVAAAAAPAVAATPKQEGFLRKLLNERDHGWDATEEFIAALLTNRKATSASIDLLLGMPKAAAPKFTADAVATLEDGIYRYGDTFYKVYHTVHGANVQVAKVLHLTKAGVDDNGKQLWNGEWEYLGKKPLYSLKPEHKLTQEQAKQFGLVYGMCCNCTRDLTREESIYVGYGPTCAANNDWWYPSKAELKSLLLDLEAKAHDEEIDQDHEAACFDGPDEPAWKAQVKAAEQDSMEDYINEPF